MRSHPKVPTLLAPLSLIAPPLGVTALLWMTRANPVTSDGVFCSFCLLLLPWGAFRVWREEERGGLPVFAMVGMAYWWYFVIGMFWLSRVALVGGHRVVAAEDVSGVLWMALASSVS